MLIRPYAAGTCTALKPRLAKSPSPPPRSANPAPHIGDKANQRQTMRLLNTNKLQLEEFGDSDIPPYAILSHTWQGREVTLQEIKDIDELERESIKIPRIDKIRNACSVARQDGFEYIWIDTCCIDKTSSSELSEAINSMYRWYQQSDVCYAYLADVPSNAVDVRTGRYSWESAGSRWFTRGWTLQELIAPSDVIFLNEEWKEIGTKLSLQESISDITGIPVRILQGGDLRGVSIAQKMSWASKRSTTRVEDTAYCLLGIFGIHMPILYGEGENAFIRLQQEIMKISVDHSIFAWRSNENYSGLLANSPKAFADSGGMVPAIVPSFGSSNAIIMDSKGIHLQVLLEGRTGVEPKSFGTKRMILPCRDTGCQDVYVAIYVEAMEEHDKPTEHDWYIRAHSDKLGLVKMGDLKSPFPGFREKKVYFAHAVPILEKKEVGFRGCAVSLGSMEGVGVNSHIIHLCPGWAMRGNYISNPNPGGIFDPGFARLVIVFKDGAWCQIILRRTTRGLRANVIIGNEPDPLGWPDNGDRSVETLEGDRLLRTAIRKQIPPIGLGVCDVVDIGYTSPLIPDNPARWFEYVAVVDPTIRGDGLMLYAARNGLVPILKLFLAKAAGPEIRDADGATPLSLAAEAGQEEVVALLLKQHNVNADTRDNSGRSPLWKAAGRGHKEIVKLLLETGTVQPDAKDNHGQSPLAWAAWNGQEDTVMLLLGTGRVDANSKDRIGRTPLWIAKQEGHAGVLKLLQKYKMAR